MVASWQGSLHWINCTFLLLYFSDSQVFLSFSFCWVCSRDFLFIASIILDSWGRNATRKIKSVPSELSLCHLPRKAPWPDRLHTASCLECESLISGFSFSFKLVIALQLISIYSKQFLFLESKLCLVRRLVAFSESRRLLVPRSRSAATRRKVCCFWNHCCAV